jgi:hypothetical protein
MAQLHLVVDTKGAGRVVGVFTDPDRAARILAIDPNYFRLIALEADTINPSAVDWLPAPKREALRSA